MTDKEKAKQVKIETLYRGQLRTVGEGKLSGLCPFHNDTNPKNPNFIIYTNTNSWYCFQEGRGGDVISFYMNLTGLPFKDVIKELAS